MKIAIISDTHERTPSPFLIDLFNDTLSSANYIIHAGDLTGAATLDFFEIYETLAVAGNRDEPAVCARLPLKRTLTINGLRLGVAHGWGEPVEADIKARSLFDEPLDIMIYGHTHKPSVNWVTYKTRRELWLNPGPANRKIKDCPASMIWLYLDDVPLSVAEEPRAEIVKL